jgi:N-acetylmuramoyl-L-alanine amidase
MKLLFFYLLLVLPTANSFVVLIDPGHGGEELGAMKKIRKKVKGKVKNVMIYEKDLTLRLAKLVKEKLDPYYTTYLTRSFDRTVELNARSEMAETVKADLFISIHFNSSKATSSHGFETYYLDNHKDVAVKKVENIENKYLKGAEKIVNQILIDLVIAQTVTASKDLANKVHHQIKNYVEKRHQIKDRGVKPGLFYVLALSKRPGILIEAGFISNEKEVWKLQSQSFLDNYAKAIAMGVRDFFKGKKDKDLPLF